MKTHFYLILLALLFSLTINAQDKQILKDLDKRPADAGTKPGAAKTAPADKTNNFDLKAHSDSLAQLQKKIEELNTMALKIRTDARDKKDDVKKLLLSEATNLEKQSQMVQIASSNLSSRINNYKFNQNKSTIKNYVTKTGEDNVPVYTKNLIFDSEKIMRLAKEMREEANAQPNMASKLGSMGNADEQELLALSKQVEALTQLERASQGAISGSR